jgi:hypothetical protein
MFSSPNLCHFSDPLLCSALQSNALVRLKNCKIYKLPAIDHIAVEIIQKGEKKIISEIHKPNELQFVYGKIA